MRPASAKAKGRRLQQRVAADLCAAFDLHADDVRSCPMGSHGRDVQLSAAASARIPWSIECKNQERLNLWAAFAQAEANCAAGTAPVVVAKRNHEEPLCTLRWTDALALLRDAKRSRADDPLDDDVPRLLRRLAERLEKKPVPSEDNAASRPSADAPPPSSPPPDGAP